MREENALSHVPRSNMAGVNLCARDVAVIRAYQHVNGAYPAAPTFPPYRYTWFRDGAFIAFAMDLAGEYESARRFHAWAVEVLLRHREKARRAVVRARAGRPLGSDYLHARYTLEGTEARDNWPNFQLDGLGTWLWALNEHVQRTHMALPPHWQEAVALVAEYLAALWRLPCYDLWEERASHLHTYTLAAIAAGLRAAARLTAESWHDTVAEIVALLDTTARRHGFFPKDITAYGVSTPARAVDASLIGLVVPYGIVSPEDQRWQRTLSYIEATLWRPGGGVYRYLGDRYYGGGEWTLLAAWLGWYYLAAGDQERAHALRAWVEAQADAHGYLPEQVTQHAQEPTAVAVWVRRWGPVARPLLWAHAMHLILCHQWRAKSADSTRE